MRYMDWNIVAVLAAAAASMAIGFLWYSPMLFARPWMKDMGIDENDKAKCDAMKKDAMRMYGISFIAFVVSALLLAKFYAVMHIVGLHVGLKIAFAVWAGFVATVQLTNNLFTQRPLRLFLIDTGYQLACYLAMGAILVSWK